MGCSDPSDSDDGGGTTGESDSATTPGNTTPGNDTTSGNDTTIGGGGSFDTLNDDTGGVEDSAGSATTFGMGDDMPLLTSIPDIKQGLIAVDTFVVIREVQPTSGRAFFDDEAWFYAEDITVEEFRGLQVIVDSEASLNDGRMVDLTGYVRRSEEGWALDLEIVGSGDEHEGAIPRVLTVGDLAASNAATYDDTLVGLSSEGSLELTEEGESPGVWIVRDDGSGESVLLDMRPFGVEGLPLVLGARLEQLVGVVELGEGPAMILPRDASDIVLAG